jgi:hypothetical protein
MARNNNIQNFVTFRITYVITTTFLPWRYDVILIMKSVPSNLLLVLLLLLLLLLLVLLLLLLLW